VALVVVKEALKYAPLNKCAQCVSTLILFIFHLGSQTFIKSLNLSPDHTQCGDALFVRSVAFVFRQMMDIFPVVEFDR